MSMGTYSRKHTMIAALSCAAALWNSSVQAQDQMVVASFGGAYTASQSKAFIEPYMASSGSKILTADYNGGLAELRSQVQSDNGSWDVIDLELQDAVKEAQATASAVANSRTWQALVKASGFLLRVSGRPG